MQYIRDPPSRQKQVVVSKQQSCPVPHNQLRKLPIMGSINQQHILIIGAGITGLTIAHGLQNRNIPFTIFEAEPEGIFRPREWTMGIHWSLKNLEKLLPQHLRERLIREASVDPSLDPGVYPNNTMRIYEGLEGKLVKEVGVRGEDGGEGRLLRVSRRKLRALCAEGIDVKVSSFFRFLDFVRSL